MQAFLQSKEKRQNQGSLLVEIWTLYISDGLMGAIHGQFHSIREMYVPALDLTVNLERTMNAFFNDGRRYAPKTKDHRRIADTPDPKLLETVILEGAQAEAIRNLAEIQLIIKGVKKEAESVVKDLLFKEKEKK
jgi:hypothetical protein